MKPKWQRARILSDRENPETDGAEIWVMVGTPQDIDGAWGRVERAVLTNLMWRGIAMAWGSEWLELLARDENDFAEDVPLVPWEQFLEECGANAREREASPTDEQGSE